MDKNRQQALLGALAGGSIIRVYGNEHSAPWVDYRGNNWTDAEIAQARLDKHAEVVDVVRLSKEGYEALKETI